jgi:hypothetical protein
MPFRLAFILLIALSTTAAQPQALWTMPEAVAEAGFSIDQSVPDCPQTASCYSIHPPADPVPMAIEGSVMQTVSAAPYRNKIVQLSGWMRTSGAAADGAALLWLRVDDAGKEQADRAMVSEAPVQAAIWTESKVIIRVTANADTISFGLLSRGRDAISFHDLALQVMPPQTVPTFAPFTPFNLDFSEGMAGRDPAGWIVTPYLRFLNDSYRAVISKKDCKTGAYCAWLQSPPALPSRSYASLLQSLSPERYHNKTLRLTMWTKFEKDGRYSRASLWIDTGQRQTTELEAGHWIHGSLTVRIGQDVKKIDFGVTLTGRGRVWIDGVTLEIVPDEPQPLLLSGSSAPPADAMPREEQSRVINAAARLAHAYTANLPDFLCTETIRRANSKDRKRWKPSDVLTVHLSYTNGAESDQLVAINGRPSRSGILSAGGAITEGEFGDILEELFRPHAARFNWLRQDNLRGRAVDVFSYSILRENSDYNLEFGSSVARASKVVVAHHGLVFIARDTTQILRIFKEAEIPSQFPVRESKATLDYGMAEVAGRQYLLPLKAEIHMSTDSTAFRNQVEFKEYRKFTSESAVHFDESNAEPAVAH